MNKNLIETDEFEGSHDVIKSIQRQAANLIPELVQQEQNNLLSNFRKSMAQKKSFAIEDDGQSIVDLKTRITEIEQNKAPVPDPVEQKYEGDPLKQFYSLKSQQEKKAEQKKEKEGLTAQDIVDVINERSGANNAMKSSESDLKEWKNLDSHDRIPNSPSQDLGFDQDDYIDHPNYQGFM